MKQEKQDDQAEEELQPIHHKLVKSDGPADFTARVLDRLLQVRLHDFSGMAEEARNDEGSKLVSDLGKVHREWLLR